MFLLRTHLLENPEVVFYYKGISKVNPDAPMAMRCVVGFTADDAHVFHSIYEAQELCDRLNQDKTSLREGGFAEFKVLKNPTDWWAGGSIQNSLLSRFIWVTNFLHGHRRDP